MYWSLTGATEEALSRRIIGCPEKDAREMADDEPGNTAVVLVLEYKVRVICAMKTGDSAPQSA